MSDKSYRDLPVWLTLWLPISILVMQLGVRYLDDGGGFYFKYIETEIGFIETATAIALFPAILLSALMFIRFRHLHGSLVKWWFLGVGLLCFGYLGEEISWGQHWFRWDSPEFFERHNRQNETNFHNLHIRFGRIAKTLVTVAIVIGGIIVPLYFRYAKTVAVRSTGVCELFWPGMASLPVAVLVLNIRIVERCKLWFEWQHLPLMDIDLKETQELFIALFFLIYLMSVYYRSRRT